MPRQSLDECKAEIRTLGETMGYPTVNVEKAIGECADEFAVRALRRKWVERRRGEVTRFNRDLNKREQEQMAADSALRHGALLEEQARIRRGERKRWPLGKRLDAALGELARMSTPGSSWQTSGATARDSDRPAGPPPASVVDTTGERNAITVLVECLEDRLDAEKGLLPPMDYAKMSTKDKDGMIARLTGVHAERVAELFPWLGSANTIRNRRKEWGLVPSTGLPKDPPTEAEAA